ncbi:MAG: hypothetical protein Q8N69_00740 [bacterium]|nr:hypothetical protein [bacterium]
MTWQEWKREIGECLKREKYRFAEEKDLIDGNQMKMFTVDTRKGPDQINVWRATLIQLSTCASANGTVYFRCVSRAGENVSNEICRVPKELILKGPEVCNPFCIIFVVSII